MGERESRKGSGEEVKGLHLKEETCVNQSGARTGGGHEHILTPSSLRRTEIFDSLGKHKLLSLFRTQPKTNRTSQPMADWWTDNCSQCQQTTKTGKEKLETRSCLGGLLATKAEE